MSTTPRHRILRDELLADEWWGGEQATTPLADPDGVGAAAARRRPPSGGGSPLQRLGAGVARVPARIVGRTRVNPRFRRFAVTVLSVLAITAAISGAVSVIMLNNIVIERSAELGKLDQSRRELRTENALLAAELAKLSAPPRVVRLARKRLGMEYPPDMARFVYLDAANRPMTEQRRRQLQRRARRAARAAAAGAPGAVPTNEAAATEAIAFADTAEGATDAAGTEEQP